MLGSNCWGYRVEFSIRLLFIMYFLSFYCFLGIILVIKDIKLNEKDVYGKN